MSPKLKPLPPRESSTSLYTPIASDKGLPAVAAIAAETVKCCEKSVRPASVTLRGVARGQSFAPGTIAVSPRPLT